MSEFYFNMYLIPSFLKSLKLRLKLRSRSKVCFVFLSTQNTSFIPFCERNLGTSEHPEFSSPVLDQPDQYLKLNWCYFCPLDYKEMHVG